MQLNITKIILFIAFGMANTAFADHRCCKEQNCLECSGPVISCDRCINVSLTR